jgi:hypothetical protein
MTPPRDHHDLRLVPREEPESVPPTVARLPPRPTPTPTMQGLADKQDALQVDSREQILLLRQIVKAQVDHGERLERVEAGTLETHQRLDGLAATLGNWPAPIDLARASVQGLTAQEVVAKQDGSGLCGAISALALNQRQLAANDQRHDANDNRLTGDVATLVQQASHEGARLGATQVAKSSRGKTAGAAAIATTGTFGGLLATIYALGPDGAERVGAAIRAFVGALFGG